MLPIRPFASHPNEDSLHRRMNPRSERLALEQRLPKLPRHPRLD